MDANTLDLMLSDTDDAEPQTTARHPRGRGSAVPEAERERIRLVHLVHERNVSQLAEQFGRKRSTIAAILRDEATEELRREVRAWRRARAKRKLEAAVDTAADGWVQTFKTATKKGDHRPMRDLLLHEEIVKPVNGTGAGSVVVNVGVVGPADIIIPLKPTGPSD
jgi:hypothetical protein